MKQPFHVLVVDNSALFGLYLVKEDAVADMNAFLYAYPASVCQIYTVTQRTCLLCTFQLNRMLHSCPHKVIIDADIKRKADELYVLKYMD